MSRHMQCYQVEYESSSANTLASLKKKFIENILYSFNERSHLQGKNFQQDMEHKTRNEDKLLAATFRLLGFARLRRKVFCNGSNV